MRTYPKTDVYDLESALTSLGIGEADRHRAVREGRADAGGVDPDAGAAVADGRHRHRRDRRRGQSQPAAGRSTARPIDRESAYERLSAKLRAAARDAPTAAAGARRPGRPAADASEARDAAEPGMFEKMMSSPAFKSAMRSAGTVIGREITRSIFGTGRRRRYSRTASATYGDFSRYRDLMARDRR